MFLHGVGINSWMWTAVADHLPDFRAILIDLPGHGKSRDIRWVSLEDTADKVAHTLSHLFDDSDLHLAGHSLGAYVGLTLLARTPHSFSTAMLSGVHAGGMPRQWMMKTMSYVMAPLATRPRFARKTAQSLKVPTADIDRFVAETGKTRPAAFHRAFVDVVEFELPPALSQIQTRTLVVAGSREHDLITGALDTVAPRLPHGTALRLPDAGHGWPGEHPGLFAAILKDHMAGTGSAAYQAPV